jgi:hypothetical protein
VWIRFYFAALPGKSVSRQHPQSWFWQSSFLVCLEM